LAPGSEKRGWSLFIRALNFVGPLHLLLLVLPLCLLVGVYLDNGAVDQDVGLLENFLVVGVSEHFPSDKIAFFYFLSLALVSTSLRTKSPESGI